MNNLARLTLVLAAVTGLLTSSVVPACATVIQFLDGTETVQLFVDGKVVAPPVQNGEMLTTNLFTTGISAPAPFNGGIVFTERTVKGPISDIITVKIFQVNRTLQTGFSFFSDPNLGNVDTTGFPRFVETDRLTQIGTDELPFRTSKGQLVMLPPELTVFFQSDIDVPEPKSLLILATGLFLLGSARYLWAAIRP